MASSFEPLFTAPPAATPGWLGQVGVVAGFTPDPRFADIGRVAEEPGDAGEAQQAQAERERQLADAFAAGESKGRSDALAEKALGDAARGELALALARLDEQLVEQLSHRLAETVAALCEATLAPLALDREALQKRCIGAAELLGDGLIDASLHLHPEDVRLLDRDFAATWHILPDPRLERGTVRFDAPEGVVVDGPGEWRAAINEALGLC